MSKLPRLTSIPKLVVSLGVITTSLVLTALPVLAERLESDSYVINFGNFNVTSGEKSSANYNVTDTVGQTADGPYGTYGSTTYFVGSGFQYIYQIGTFGFSISNVAIDLGELIIGTHSSGTNTLTVNSKGGYGYTVYAFEEHPLRHSNGTDFIPDTTCDNGLCSETTAQVWTNGQIPGFGFTITGQDVVSGFTDTTYFKQFADVSQSETMQAVMHSDDVGSGRQATVTYKVGIDANQAAGNYQTAVVYVAVPGY